MRVVGFLVVGRVVVGLQVGCFVGLHVVGFLVVGRAVVGLRVVGWAVVGLPRSSFASKRFS